MNGHVRVFAVKYYSAVKYVYIMTVAWMQWVDLEKIRLSEVRQTQKGKCFVFSLRLQF